MRAAVVEPGPGQSGVSGVDALMERASTALEDALYFDAWELAWEALILARRAGAFERMARICMPLLEARRQIRQLATDHATGQEAGRAPIQIIAASEDIPRPIAPGCYLFAPPLLGIDARRFREQADQARVPVFALAREPSNRAGLVPVVGVGDVVSRVRLEGYAGDAPDLAWFERAAEALGDEAIRSAEDVAEDDPPAFLVDDLLERLPGVVDHEKVHQRLERACRDATNAPAPTSVRRRAAINDPFAF